MVPLRFHLDESVDPDIADGLQVQGIDVTTTQESGLRTSTDETQLQFALRKQRVIVTHDADFLRLAAKGREHAGIVYCAPHSRSLGEIILGCVSLYHNESSESMTGRIEFL